jgi:plastocyanin
MKKGFILAIGVAAIWGVSSAQAGSVSGTIKLGVAAPEMKMIKVDKDTEVCGTEERAPEKLILSKDKGVANAVITIKGVQGGKKLDPSKKIEFNQKKCQFQPHILIIPKGAEIDIINNDPITHNIHTFPKENAPLNKAQPTSLKKITSPKFEVAEVIKVQCDIHRGLMSAWFVVADSPYTVVSDASGNFKITDVPDGTYQVEIWHEALGKETKEVTIKGGDAKLDVSLSPKKG